MTALPHDVIPDIMSYIDDQTFLTHHYNLVIRSPRLEKRREQLLEERTRGRVEKICTDLSLDAPDLLSARNDDEKSQILYWLIEDMAWQLIPYKQKPVYIYKHDLRTRIVTSNLMVCARENRFVPSKIKENSHVDATYRLRPLQRNFLRKQHFDVLALIY